MENRVNVFAPSEAMDYRRRIAILRERKLEQTRIKSRMRVYQDGDDYGSVPAPADYRFVPIPTCENGSWYGYEGWSRNFHKLMCEHPVYIDPVDAFSCRWMYCMAWFDEKAGKNWNPEYPYDGLIPLQERYGVVPGIGADAHFAGDYAMGLSLGWGGLLEKLEAGRRNNPGRDRFYDAERLTIEGVQAWMQHAIDECRRLAALEKHPVLRSNLLEMAAVNERIRFGAPETLREACQWVCWFNMASRTYNRDGAGFQLDGLLKPYCDRDLAAGRITRDEAVFYIACLLLNDPHYYQLGGLDAEGRPLVSEFSWMALEAAELLDSSCNITIRVDPDIDRAFLHRAVECLFRHRNGWPRFSGEKALSQGFMRLGYPQALARQRIAVGCHWMSLPGLEYTLNDCVKINCAKAFELALDEMMADGGPRSTRRLWALYEGHMKDAVAVTARGIRFHLDHQEENEPELLLNLISHGPVETGQDVTRSARYFNMCVDDTAIATVADSFGALEQRIEREGRIGWDDMYRHLRANFMDEGGEAVRRMLSASGRYGGGETLADGWAVRISEAFSRQVRAMDGDYPGLVFIPGWFSWSNTIALGKQVRATPNGRRDFEPISHGANPHPGFRRDGAVTAMTNAICSVQCGYGNTAPVQLELDPGMGGDEEAVKKIADYILTLFDLGGTLLNVNIIDSEQILEADRDPDRYPDLVVRVTGFTAYFCSLTPEFRKLVVDRILRR